MNIFALILVGLLITLLAIVICIVGYYSYYHHQDKKIARENMNATINRKRQAPVLYLRAPSQSVDK
jgi:uncharacterized membrane protein